MRDHTNLLAWQEARAVAVGSLELSRRLWAPTLAAVFDQLSRASLSAQLNLAEGYALMTPGKTSQHWNTAYGSSVEAVECLELLRDAGGLPKEPLDELIERGRRSSRLILGLLRRRTASRRKGV